MFLLIHWTPRTKPKVHPKKTCVSLRSASARAPGRTAPSREDCGGAVETRSQPARTAVYSGKALGCRPSAVAPAGAEPVSTGQSGYRVSM